LGVGRHVGRVVGGMVGEKTGFGDSEKEGGMRDIFALPVKKLGGLRCGEVKLRKDGVKAGKARVPLIT